MTDAKYMYEIKPYTHTAALYSVCTFLAWHLQIDNSHVGFYGWQLL